MNEDAPNMQPLRDEFLRLLTEDSVTTDRRRRDYNQAIFSKGSGDTVWVPTTGYLDMVMEKYDKAVKNVQRGKR